MPRFFVPEKLIEDASSNILLLSHAEGVVLLSMGCASIALFISAALFARFLSAKVQMGLLIAAIILLFGTAFSFAGLIGQS